MNRAQVFQFSQRSNVYLLWTVLVPLNAVMSLLLAFEKYHKILDKAGMLAGVITFVVLYAELDWFLISNNLKEWHKALIISALLKMLTQFAPVIEIITGYGSTVLVELVLGRIEFFSVYMQTIVDGFLLSIVVAVVAMPIRFLLKVKEIDRPLK